MKKNNNSEYYSDWTTQKLKQEAMAYHAMVNIEECYGSSDVVALSGIIAELEDRGYETYYLIQFRKV